MGHAIMSLMVPGTDPLHKVSIIPRGMALGVTQQMPIDDKHMYDKQDLYTRILSLMGGRAAEEVFYGKEGITTGAENDLQRATELAYRMVSMWGMSERVGPLAVRRTINPFLGGMTTSVDISEELRREIDEEVRNILTKAYEDAKRIVLEHKEAIQAVVKRLLEKETMSCEEVVEILKLYGVEVKNECKKEEFKVEEKKEEVKEVK
jgi:cell division protease FtsH